ncbi:MAG: 2-amino-4-hydroxy-6-hydroxymethyldihydropteridine diphosphokinase [Thermoleophilia bacterium]
MDGRARVYLSLGSNQGDSPALLAQASRALEALPDTRVTARSSVFRTAPVGYRDQPDFLNQVVALETALDPHALLEQTQRIEHEAGRVRGVRWGPRTLDIDILWYDGKRVHDERLEVPHPRLEERRFVLEPLAELAPTLVLPSGRTVCEALTRTRGQQVNRYHPGRGS